MKYTTARRGLEQEQERLLHAQRVLRSEHLDLEPESDSFGELVSIDQHQADMGSEVFEREKDFSILAAIQRRLAEVADAFERLDAGEYGRCQTCGEPISDERLEAVPAARFCADDESYWEVTRLTTSPPSGPMPGEQGTPLARVIEFAALLSLDDLPHDDDVVEALQVAAEEASIHLARLGDTPGRRMSAEEIELAEDRHSEEESVERAAIEEQEAERRRDEEAVASEEGQVG